MKIAVLLAYAVLTSRKISCASIPQQLNQISLTDITDSERKHLEYLNSHYSNSPRTRRSSDEALHSLKASIGQGIKSKLGLLAKSSASASSSFSSGSSGKHYHHHDVHSDYDHHKSFDFWTLKKSILNTLLQAVKAIKGGVIAIKGQLIKGSGYLISAKGKLISSKGEAITKLGKNIATSAVLSPTHGHHSEEYHAHYHHSAPEEYGSPSAPGPEYEVPEHHFHHHPPLHEDKPEHDHHGILILKKIPVHHDHSSEHLSVEHKVPDFKHLKEHKGPGLGEIIKKFFSASTSLKPGHPAPFTDDDYYHSHDHEIKHSHDDHHEHHSDDHYHDDHHDDHYEHDDHHNHHDIHSSHEEYHAPHPSHIDSDHEYSSPVHSTSKHKPSSPSLFEEAPSFLNLAEHTSETRPALDIKPTPKTPFSSLDFAPTAQLSDAEKANLFAGSFADKPNLDFPPYHSKPGSLADSFGAFPNPSVNPTLQYLAAPEVGPQVFPNHNYGFVDPQTPYPPSVKYHAYLDNLQSSFHKRPTRSKNHRKRPVFPSPSFMRALSKLAAANGPKRV